ncbi:MAG: hypothetical protein AUJ12_03845 [Alphaproteobacteria bacterium CG1_02_46_17]|nr:MAG: hypothetical protein AUJ12_03845 [Alphaproteobacteria bacterium CG1_02_46_17]
MTQQQQRASLSDIFGLTELAKKISKDGNAALTRDDQALYKGLSQQERAVVQSMLQDCSI